jgi:ribosomal protein L5
MESKQLMHESKDQTQIPRRNITLSVSTVPSNTTRYYFENILRFDLLSKFNYNNIMQVPHITKINILVHGVPTSNINPVSLALESVIGQKVRSTTALTDAQNESFKGSLSRRLSSAPSSRLQKKNERSKKSGNFQVGKITRSRGTLSIPSAALLCCSLRGRTKYNFLEKFISLRLATLNDSEYNCKILGQEVQLTFSNREVRLFPEIQNHFEFFESLNKIQINLVTSARSEMETRLLWAGLKQNEI